MAIPNVVDFNNLIELFEELDQRYLLPKGREKGFSGAEEDYYQFATEIYDSWIERTSLWSSMPAQIWMESQPGYWLGYELLFGERPPKESRSDAVKLLINRLRKAYQPIGVDEYAEYEKQVREKRNKYISEESIQRDIEHKRYIEGIYDNPREVEDYYFVTDEEIRESAEFIYPLSSFKEINSETRRVEKVRNVIYWYSTPRGQFEWAEFVTKQIRDYFYSDEVDLNNDVKNWTDELRQLENVENGVLTTIKYLEKQHDDENYVARFRDEIDTDAGCSGPIISEAIKLSRQLEHHLLDLRHEIELNRNLLSAPSIIQRKDRTYRERVFIVKMHHKLKSIKPTPSITKSAEAISHFLSIEGIENNLDVRSITRTIRKAIDADSYLEKNVFLVS